MKRTKEINLGYSIKSQLGSPATILNASRNTDFKYRIEGIKKEDIENINKIKTKTKLLDRINSIKNMGGKIIFDSVVSKIFNRNLQMIDMLLPDALAEILLNSYILADKNLLHLILNSTIYKDKEIAVKKIKDFLLACSLGMFPGKEWNGRYKADGGIIIVSLDSNVYVLDFIYYKDEVEEYLIKQTKLDTPSTSRYHMLELFEENGEIYFTLNLQVRYIK